METRKERHAKYRQKILALPSSAFAPNGKYLAEWRDLGAVAPSSSSISYSGDRMGSFNNLEPEENSTPYRLYLKRRGVHLALKLIFLGLGIAILIAAYFLLLWE